LAAKEPVMRVSLDMLVGAWALVSAEATSSDGHSLSHPFGVDPQGLLLYTSDGWMSATITTFDDTSETPGPALYAGRVSVVDNEVVHTVLVGVPPFGPGTVQRRIVSHRGPDELVLATPPGDVTTQTITLTWRRRP
jgi:hypothetical protein